MSLSEEYRLVNGAPSVPEYLALRQRSGLSPKLASQAEAAIAGTWAFRHVVGPDGTAVAMGRVVGDGGWYFLIADMATLPEHQGNGLGGAVLDARLAEIGELAPSDAYVTLTADPPGRGLYEKRGFRDVSPGQTGMSLTVRG